MATIGLTGMIQKPGQSVFVKLSNGVLKETS